MYRLRVVPVMLTYFQKCVCVVFVYSRYYAYMKIKLVSARKWSSSRMLKQENSLSFIPIIVPACFWFEKYTDVPLQVALLLSRYWLSHFQCPCEYMLLMVIVLLMYYVHQYSYRSNVWCE